MLCAARTAWRLLARCVSGVARLVAGGGALMGTTFMVAPVVGAEFPLPGRIEGDLRQRVEQARELRPWPKGTVGRAVTRKERRR